MIFGATGAIIKRLWRGDLARMYRLIKGVGEVKNADDLLEMADFDLIFEINGLRRVLVSRLGKYISRRKCATLISRGHNPAILIYYVLPEFDKCWFNEIIRKYITDNDVEFAPIIHQRCLEWCARGRDSRLAKKMISDPNFTGEDILLREAVRDGYVDILYLLLKKEGIRERVNLKAAISMCFHSRNYLMMELLLSAAGEDDVEGYFLSDSCLLGDAKMVSTLLNCPHIDAGYDNNLALSYACELGYANIVKMLVGRHDVNVEDRAGRARRVAECRGRTDILKILAEHTNKKLNGGDITVDGEQKN